MTTAIILTVYLCSVYGFALFLYDHYNNDPDQLWMTFQQVCLVHTIIFCFSALWPVTIGVISLIRAVKK